MVLVNIVLNEMIDLTIVFLKIVDTMLYIQEMCTHEEKQHDEVKLNHT